ncbi:restriction endonuclease subunit S [Tolumonas osonensis]|uniref:Type I restriction enzyme S subunit n=1 Tax=Tolumonas osonensis TaxID=675874 RepID=A0A841GBF7_9GAMM|nr:restriction endonuclease subunit S [Tolumonas osonensis]MBB6055269.1 type I restriction enzyme S subunit [Tolumonas osonensis]
MGSKNLDENQWNQTTWGEIVELKYGKALKDYQGAQAEFPVYGTNGPVGFCDTPLCQYPSVIVGRKGAYRGIHYSDKPFFVIDTAFYIHPLININLKWAYYHLLTQDINGLDSGSAIPSTRREDFYALPVNIPPRWIQDEIVNKLDSLEKKITLNRQINQTLEQMAQTLFKSWFVDFDPVIDNALDAGNDIPDTLQERAEQRRLLRAKADFKPLPAETRALFPSEFEETELGWVPKGWDISTTGDEFEVKGGSTPSTANPEFWENGDIHWTSPKDLSDLDTKILLDTSRKITEAGLKKITSGLLPENTVLMSSRAPVGYLALAKIPVAINQGYIAIPSAKNFTAEYIIQWLDSNMDQIKGMAGGTTFAEISKSTFKTIEIVVPTKPVILEFTKMAKTIFDKITSNVKETSSLSNIRDSLLPKLISGELALHALPEVPELAEAR